MANITPMTLIIVVVILGFITPYLSSLSLEYSGNYTVTNSLIALDYNVNSNFTNRVMIPLIGNPSGRATKRAAA